jgi:lycopene cyclase domain-containing protein
MGREKGQTTPRVSKQPRNMDRNWHPHPPGGGVHHALGQLSRGYRRVVLQSRTRYWHRAGVCSAFFVLETLLAGLWWWFLARRLPEPMQFKPSKIGRIVSFAALFILWVVFTVLFFSESHPITYLSLTLFWAFPAIFPQLLYGADILWHYRKLVGLGILVPGTYLSLMDIVALRDTTWSISKEQTTGILFFGILPLEEVVFFFITNILITFGITLLLSNIARQRFAGWKSRSFRGLP